MTDDLAPQHQDNTTRALPLDEGDVADLLGELGEIAASCGLRSLEREIVEERLPALSSGRLTLVVLGEFNHGKSTVINALLGEEVLPMGVTPTTALITHLVHGDTPAAALQPAGGAPRVEVPLEELAARVKDSGEAGQEPEYIEIAHPNAVLQESLVLVDTPGINDISRQRVEITYGYLPRADVILYVLDATQALKKSEVTFIKNRLLKANRDRIVFVLNKIDALDPEDVPEVEHYVRERLEELVGPVELFSFSGREALDAQGGGGAAPEGFVAFKSYLQALLREQRAFILLDSALAGGLRVSALLEQNLAIKRQGYQLEADELRARIDAVRDRLDASKKLTAEHTRHIDERVHTIAQDARHNLREFVAGFVEQLPAQIDAAEARDVKRFLPGWIQDTFKAWLEREGQDIAGRLEGLAEEIIEITNESLRDIVEMYRDEFGLAGELDLEVDTIAYDVSVFALGAFGVSVFLIGNVLVGSLLTLAAPVLAFFLKEKADARIKERAREEGVRAIEHAGAKLEEELLRVIHDYGDRLKAFVDTAGDRLYRQIEEALSQVQSELEARGEGADRAQLLADTDALLHSARRVGKLIQVSRAHLGQHAAHIEPS